MTNDRIPGTFCPKCLEDNWILGAVKDSNPHYRIIVWSCTYVANSPDAHEDCLCEYCGFEPDDVECGGQVRWEVSGPGKVGVLAKGIGDFPEISALILAGRVPPAAAWLNMFT